MEYKHMVDKTLQLKPNRMDTSNCLA